MHRMITMMIITLGASGVIACSAKSYDNTPVPSLNLERYLGKWYEIARFDHRFEKDLQYATAEYSMMKNGRVKVVNSGIKGKERKTSTGRAHLTKTPGLLRVSFFRPFWSDYRVLLIGPNYEYALVGSRSRKYLWILSRTPSMSESSREEVLGEACLRGYDISNLIWVKQ